MLRCPAFTCFPSNEPIIREREDAYTLKIAAPGIEREDLKLTIEDGTLLKVTGKSGGSYVNYNLRLPKNADGDSVQAHTSDGLLIVTVSKREAPNKITVPSWRTTRRRVTRTANIWASLATDRVWTQSGAS